MITSAISSAARLSLAPARLAGRMAGSLLSELRGHAANADPEPPSARGRQASRTRAKAQPKRGGSRTPTKAHSKRAGSRTGAKAQRQRGGSRTRAKAQPKRAPRRTPLDDATIARKVESAIFQGVDVDKGKVDVNVAEGVAWLRGEVPTQDLVTELEARAAGVTEVGRVENLLHLAKTPAPSSTETPGPERETSHSAERPEDRAVTLGETSDEEPAPASALPTSSPAAGRGPGPATVGSASGVADSADRTRDGDESAEQAGPDVSERDKDQAHQPSDRG